MEEKREYLDKAMVGIIAPAGYGKTEEIANAVKICSGKQLVLTHTRAGVAALQTRMKKKHIEKNKFEIDTIASFCMKWCKAYPITAKVHFPDKISEIDYLSIYKGTKIIFSMTWAKKVLRQTYSGIFIDEYQDCTQSQHEIFMEIENLIPIRIFGDPLQGIFYWVQGDKIVNWNSFAFKVICPLNVPRRWEKTNMTLGLLLDDLRKKIIVALDGKDVMINIRDVPECMTVLDSKQWNNGQFAYEIKNYENIVYLSTFKSKQQSFSQHNGGFFQCDEVKDLAEAEKIIASIEAEKNEKKALILLEKLKCMINGVQTELGSYIKNLEKGKSDFRSE